MAWPADPTPAGAPTDTPAGGVPEQHQPTTADTHTVKAGEYPGKIATVWHDNQELLSVNGISDPRSLQVGQVLRWLPDGREHCDVG